MSEKEQNVGRVDATNDMSDFGKNVENAWENLCEFSNELAGTDMSCDKYSMGGGLP